MKEPGRGESGPRVVGTHGARDADELARLVADPATDACDLLELRLDRIHDPAAHVERLVAAARVPVLATCRRADEGGRAVLDEAARIDVLRRAAASGAAWVDLEVDVPDSDADRVAAEGASLVRSLHAPRWSADADAAIERLLAAPGGIAKFVALAGNDRDAVALLERAEAHAGRLAAHIVERPFTRVAAAVLGSPLVYGALRPGGTLGIALPTVRALRRSLTRRTVTQTRRLVGARVFLLLGADVSGSVSPEMLNAAFEAAGADLVSLRWSTDDPGPALDALLRFGWAGAAVTIPHKRTVADAVLARGGRLCGDAQRLGVVNTVLVEEGALVGHNTDVPGLLDALRAARPSLALDGGAGVILGAGGAARAAVAVVRELGGEPVVFARRAAAAHELATALPRERVRVVEKLADAVAAAPRLLIDATPAGPPGGVPLIDPAQLPHDALVTDLLVAHAPTALVAAARSATRAAVPGFEMLLHQALHQLRLLGVHGVEPQVPREAGERRAEEQERRVVLVGLRCTGKSTVGELVAQLLGRTFLDTDREAARRAGASPDQLIATGQQARFRTVEAEVLRAASGGHRTVVATGGGAALHREALELLCLNALVVWLRADDATLLGRLATEPRAALTKLPAAQELARQRAEREPHYERLASVSFDTAALPAAEIAEIVAARLT